TRDHSLVQEMVDRGELLPEEAKHHPRKDVITMALGVFAEVTPDIGCLAMEPGDSVLLCCDGLINHVEDEDIHRVVVETSDPQRACEILVGLANRGGGTDNISVIIARAPPVSTTREDVRRAEHPTSGPLDEQGSTQQGAVPVKRSDFLVTIGRLQLIRGS